LTRTSKNNEAPAPPTGKTDSSLNIFSFFRLLYHRVNSLDHIFIRGGFVGLVWRAAPRPQPSFSVANTALVFAIALSQAVLLQF
jgi:hypothetical protein